MTTETKPKRYKATVNFPSWILEYFQYATSGSLYLKNWDDCIMSQMVKRNGQCLEFKLNEHRPDYREICDGLNYSPQWLTNIEEIKPEIDWSTVKRDTPIIVDGSLKRYFAADGTDVIYYYTEGRTQWSNDGERPLQIRKCYAKLADESERAV